MNASRAKIRVGARDSVLAVLQARLVMDAVRRVHPEIDFELLAMKTSGDRILDRPLDAFGGKGLFVKELDDALLNGRVDICVHSYKDLPTPSHPDLPVLAVSAREDPRDALVPPAGSPEPDPRLPLGTSSARRRLQLATLYPDWKTEPVRGNVHTRLAKLDAGRYGGLVLAAAGLRRLGLADRVRRFFSPEEMIPSPCQGILAVQGRAGEKYPWLAVVDDADARDASRAERAFVQALGCGCSDPVAAHARVRGRDLLLTALRADADGVVRKGSLTGPRSQADGIGRELAHRLLSGKEGHG